MVFSFPLQAGYPTPAILHLTFKLTLNRAYVAPQCFASNAVSHSNLTPGSRGSNRTRYGFDASCLLAFLNVTTQEKCGPRLRFGNREWIIRLDTHGNIHEGASQPFGGKGKLLRSITDSVKSSARQQHTRTAHYVATYRFHARFLPAGQLLAAFI